MFKLLIAVIALGAAFQGVCGMPVPEQSDSEVNQLTPDFLAGLLGIGDGSSPIAGYPFQKRQDGGDNASEIAALQELLASPTVGGLPLPPDAVEKIKQAIALLKQNKPSCIAFL